MSEEQQVFEEEQMTDEATAEQQAGAKKETVTEEIKVQAQDLFKTINDLIREGTVRRITIMRNDRILVDIPLAVGMAASVVLAMYLPVISALTAIGALLAGCTLRIEREQPPAED